MKYNVKNKFFFFVIAPIIIVSNFSSCSEKKMTAKDYYYHILPENYSEFFVLSESELERISKRYGYSESIDEMKDIYKNNIAQELNYLLEDIVKNAPSKYDVPFNELFAGVYPSVGRFNARTFQSPNGEYLILLDYDLKKCLWEWAKLVINIVFLLQANPELTPDDSIERITFEFRESIRNFSNSGTIPAFPEYAKDDKSVLAALLYNSAAKYILAHEYAHIVLGHMKPTPFDINKLDFEHKKAALQSEEYFLKEVEADSVGASIFLNHSSKDDFIYLDDGLKIAGIFYCLVIFEILEQLDNQDTQLQKGTFPQMYTRLGNIKKYLENNYANSFHFAAIDIINALAYLADKSIITKKQLSELSIDDILKLKFYQAYKANDQEAIKTLIENNIAIFSEHAEVLISSSHLYAKGNLQAMSTNWSNGDFINSFELLEMSIKINSFFKSKTNRNLIEDIEKKSGRILELLRTSAETFDNKLPSAKRDKLQQAKKVADLISVEFPNEFLYQKGLVEYERGNYLSAFNIWEVLAQKNHSRSQYKIGQLFLNGQGVNQDNQSAIYWISKAASNQDDEAQNHLGALYFSGQAIGVDHIKAEELFLAASNKGNISSYHNLGVLYLYSEKVGNLNKTILWFERAAEKGYINSIYNLIIILYKKGTNEDLITCLKWIEIYKYFDKSSQSFTDDLKNIEESIKQQITPINIQLSIEEAENWLIKFGFMKNVS